MIGHRAVYEGLSADGEERMLLELAVVGFLPPDKDGRDGAALVLRDEEGTVARFDCEFTDRRGNSYRPLHVTTVEHVIAAEPGWFVHKEVPALDDRPRNTIGDFEIIAWVTNVPPGDDAPGGDALVLVERNIEYCYAGPIRQSDLPGVASYYRARSRRPGRSLFETATTSSNVGRSR